MPNLTLRKSDEVPIRKKGTSAQKEQQALYEGFIKQIADNVGELQLGEDERSRSVKVSLRRASKRLGTELEIWEVDGRVYFRRQSQRRPGRRRRTD